MADKTIIWDDSFLNDNPHGDTGLVRDTGYYINETRQALTERLDDEHIYDPNEPAPQPNMGMHKHGSAVSYAQDTEPTLRPDGITPLNIDDKGRLWFDTLNGQIKGWDGTTGWVNLSAQGVGTILRWQNSAQYYADEIVESDGRLWQAVVALPPVGVFPDIPDWRLYLVKMPDVIEWSSDVIYASGQVTYSAGVFWKGVSPVQGSPPGAIPAEWTALQMGNASIADNSITQPKMADNSVGTAEIIDSNVTTAKILDANVTAAKLATNSVQTAKIVDLNVTTAKIADKATTFSKAGPDLYKVHIWDSTIPYLINDIVRYNDRWWLALTNPPIGTVPTVTGNDWRRVTPQSTDWFDNTGSVTNGRPDHCVFCNTSVNPVYTVTLDDGKYLGDRVTIAAFGGGEITIVGTGLVDQTQNDTSVQYMWSSASWLPLGGGSAGGGSGVSVGEVTWWPGQSDVGIPEGKLVADGTIYNIADYPTLFGKLGTLYGGDGATTFGVPNLQGIFPGAQGTQGTHGGAEAIGALREDSLESHTHVQNSHTHTLPTHQHLSGFRYEEATPESEALYGFGAIVTASGERWNIAPTVSASWKQYKDQLVNAGPTNASTAVNQSTGGTETRPTALVGRWLIQAEPPVPTEINAVVVDVEIGDVRWQGHTNQSAHDMICDGRSLITTSYPDLFAKIGYNFGGSGSNFNIPNLQGITPGAFGTQDVNARTKGDATAIGGIREDQDQLITGSMQNLNPVTDAYVRGILDTAYPDGHVLNGAFKKQGKDASNRTFNAGTGDFAGYLAFDSSLVARTGTYSRSTELVGHWVIRATQPASYALPVSGLPPGGTTGQVLEKKTATDFETQWTSSPSTVLTSLFNMIYPVGSVVVRYPGETAPNARGWPGTWVDDSANAAWAGRVFRTVGGLAPAYGATQEDAVKTLFFPCAGNTSAGDARSMNSASGYGFGGLSTTSGGWAFRNTFVQDSMPAVVADGAGSAYPQASETRIKSVGIQVWKRTA